MKGKYFIPILIILGFGMISIIVFKPDTINGLGDWIGVIVFFGLGTIYSIWRILKRSE